MDNSHPAKTSDASGSALAMRPRDAARALGISERTLYAWTIAGTIPHVRVGRTVLYPVHLLREWLGRRAGAAKAEDPQ